VFNFAADILMAVGDEVIEAIWVAPAKNENSYFHEGASHDLGDLPVSWERAFPVLNYEYDNDWGNYDFHHFYLWTEKSVFYMSEFDGKGDIHSVPRNPEDKKVFS